MRRRCPSKMDPRRFDLAISYARMLPLWQNELAGDLDNAEREDLQRRVDLIMQAAEKAAKDAVMRDYLLLSIINGMEFEDLRGHGMPCGKNYLTKIKHSFLAELADRIR